MHTIPAGNSRGAVHFLKASVSAVWSRTLLHQKSPEMLFSNAGSGVPLQITQNQSLWGNRAWQLHLLSVPGESDGFQNLPQQAGSAAGSDLCALNQRELFKGKASIFTLEGPSNLCIPNCVTQKQVVGMVGTGRLRWRHR